MVATNTYGLTDKVKARILDIAEQRVLAAALRRSVDVVHRAQPQDNK